MRFRKFTGRNNWFFKWRRGIFHLLAVFAVFMSLLVLPRTANATLGSSSLSLPFDGAATCVLCGQVQYACSNGTGNWNSGAKTFTDPIPSGGSVKAIYVYVDYTGNCSGSGSFDLYFNGNLVSTTSQLGTCQCDDICNTNTFYPDTTNYIYGGSNSLQIVTNGVTMCVSKYRVLVVYDDNTTPPVVYNQTMNVAGGYMYIPSGAYIVTNGRVICESGGSIDNSGSIKLQGNWVNNGTGLINASPGSVEFNGTANQTISGNTITDFYDVNINNAANVTLATNANVANFLTFTTGKITTGPNAVSITSNPPLPIVGAGTGSYVDGNLNVLFPGGSSVTYNYEIGGGVYAPASLALNGITTGGSVTGSTAQGPSPAESSFSSGMDPAQRADQHWIFNNNTTVFSDYNITFDFTNTTYTGNPANYEIRKFDPNAWALTNSSVTGTTIQATGLTSFSEFAVGVGNCIPPGALVTVTNLSCAGASNGSITLTVSGGTPTYSFQWSSGEVTQNITGLSAGTYSVTITGDNGCTSTRSNLTVNSPSALAISCSGTNIQCNGSNTGIASALVTGGSPAYSYLWNNGGTTSSLSNLAAGTYTVTVTDQCGSTNCSYSVTEPSALTVSCNGANISCYGAGNGSVTAVASGGTGSYSYSWSNGFAGASNANLSQGTYSVTVVDDNGCKSSCSYNVIEPALLTVSVNSNTPVCEGTNLTLSSAVTGGTANFNYSWSGPNSFSSTDANPVIPNASSADAGSYFVTVTDAGNCVASNFTSVTTTLCGAVLNLNLYIQGYYGPVGQMRKVLFNEGVTTNVTLVDTITVELHDVLNPNTVVETSQAILMTNNNATATFSTAVIGNSYWIVILHRNAVQTWSSGTVAFATTTNYDFTTDATKAYGSNQVKVNTSPDHWAFYSGNIVRDFNIDLIDFPPLDLGINNGLYGYNASDLNGDGNVDLLDFPVLDGNINTGIFVSRP